MIFPIDVHKVINNSSKIVGENKIQAIVVGAVLSSVFLFFGLNYFLNLYFGFGLGVTIAIYLVILIIVFILLFRFVIFDEDSKKKELEDSTSDSFSKYMWLRSDIHTNVSVHDEKVSVYEYVNGSAVCVLELRFGSNDDDKAAATRLANEKMMYIAGSHNLESRIIDVPENFRNSNEFRRHIASLNQIKDKQAAKNAMLINDAIMEESCKLCNVDVVYLMLRTMDSQHRSDLEIALKKIFVMLKQSGAAYRSIHFLSAEELMEFFREFYKIAAIDLSMMKTIELSQQVTEEFQNVVSVMQLSTKSGRVFSTNEELFSDDIRKLN